MPSHESINGMLGVTGVYTNRELCRHNNININSKYKPMQISKGENVTDTDRKNARWGFTYNNIAEPFSCDDADIIIWINAAKNKTGLTYVRPSSHYRLGDFVNYSKTATTPFYKPVCNADNVDFGAKSTIPTGAFKPSDIFSTNAYYLLCYIANGDTVGKIIRKDGYNVDDWVHGTFPSSTVSKTYKGVVLVANIDGDGGCCVLPDMYFENHTIVGTGGGGTGGGGTGDTIQFDMQAEIQDSDYSGSSISYIYFSFNVSGGSGYIDTNCILYDSEHNQIAENNGVLINTNGYNTVNLIFNYTYINTEMLIAEFYDNSTNKNIGSTLINLSQ